MRGRKKEDATAWAGPRLVKGGRGRGEGSLRAGGELGQQAESEEKRRRKKILLFFFYSTFPNSFSKGF
jgi:hypothetical protein